MSDNQITITITMPDIFWRAIGAKRNASPSSFDSRAAFASPSVVRPPAVRRRKKRSRVQNLSQMSNPGTIALYRRGLATQDIAERCSWSTTNIKAQLDGRSTLKEDTRQALISFLGTDGFETLMRELEADRNV